jgi:hypothetical protein
LTDIQVVGKKGLNTLFKHIAQLAIICLTVWFSSCKPKHICPAYQSSFYLDQKAAALEFSPFDKDTLPKLENLVRKTDVLLIVRLGKKKIENRMAVIPMITIYPDADSLLANSDSLSADSLAADDEQLPEEGTDDLIQDSTSAEESDEVSPQEESPDEEARPKDEEPDEGEKPQEEPEPAQKKAPKKKSEKDPELSDPSLKFDFEESFQDSIPEDEILNPLPEEDDTPVPKEGGKRKAAPLNKDADKPKEEEEAEDDKF